MSNSSFQATNFLKIAVVHGNQSLVQESLARSKKKSTHTIEASPRCFLKLFNGFAAAQREHSASQTDTFTVTCPCLFPQQRRPALDSHTPNT
jgi:hypothetical protein